MNEKALWFKVLKIMCSRGVVFIQKTRPTPTPHPRVDGCPTPCYRKLKNGTRKKYTVIFTLFHHSISPKGPGGHRLCREAVKLTSGQFHEEDTQWYPKKIRGNARIWGGEHSNSHDFLAMGKNILSILIGYTVQYKISNIYICKIYWQCWKWKSRKLRKMIVYAILREDVRGIYGRIAPPPPAAYGLILREWYHL